MDGDAMLEWRRARGISQDRLAELLGVNRVTIFRWEKNKRAIPVYLERALRDLDRELAEQKEQQA
jgi:transcriptional regulator with XRE-family HTH domain